MSEGMKIAAAAIGVFVGLMIVEKYQRHQQNKQLREMFSNMKEARAARNNQTKEATA